MKGNQLNRNRQVGLVIPIYTIKYVKKTIDLVIDTCKDLDLKICIVNDGCMEVEKYLENVSWPLNVFILNLSENKCFAGANNAGWQFLIDKFPDIKYLGTLNDDTIPYNGWLHSLLDGIEKYPRVGVSAPVMITQDFSGNQIECATWQYNNISNPITVKEYQIRTDTFVPVIGGFCFLTKRKALEKVGFFDERYQNSCEDVDLSIKMITQKIRLVVCSKAKVFHYGGSSRWLLGTKTDTNKSLSLLQEKWGYDLSVYNHIQPKTIIESIVFNQEHFIEAWVRNANKYVDEIIVLYSQKPWNYNKKARDTIKTDKTGEILENLKFEFPKLTVKEGIWDDETSERNEGINIAKALDGQWLLIVDTDEFYDEHQIFDAFDWMVHNPAKLWFMQHTQLIKDKRWAIITPNGNPIFEFAIDLNHINAFTCQRTINSDNNLVIPENFCKCWHFSYLMPQHKIEEKLASFGHSHQISKDWLHDVWPNIKPGIRNFHPVNPNGWSGIDIVDIPEKISTDIKFLKNNNN